MAKPKTQRRKRKSRGSSVAKISKKVNYLMKQVNAREKKRYDANAQEDTFGQVNAQVDGYAVYDTTPAPAQALTYQGRTGSKIQVCSMVYNFQFRQMSAQTNTGRIVLELYKVPAQIWTTPSTFVESIFEANPFILQSGGASAVIVDYNSQYDPDYFKQWKLVRRKKFTIKGDTLANQTGIVSFVWPIKFKKPHIIKWNDNTTDITEGQLILLIRADNGNMSTTTASTNTGIATTAVNTGYVVNFNHKSYYYDD